MKLCPVYLRVPSRLYIPVRVWSHVWPACAVLILCAEEEQRRYQTYTTTETRTTRNQVSVLLFYLTAVLSTTDLRLGR